MFRLITTKGCGSAIIEAELTLAGLPYEIDEIDYTQPGPGLDRLKALNPLGQVPTLILPDGAVMTESAAMTLHIADLAPQAGLVPPVGHPARPAFLRWLLFFVAAIYPTFTYGDEPANWVPADAADALRASTDRHREKLLEYLERQLAPAPWLLGETFSALDLYLAVMTKWRPREAWFVGHAPKLLGVRQRALKIPELAAVWARNFD
jgi:GST-like protein